MYQLVPGGLRADEQLFGLGLIFKDGGRGCFKAPVTMRWGAAPAFDACRAVSVLYVCTFDPESGAYSCPRAPSEPRLCGAKGVYVSLLVGLCLNLDLSLSWLEWRQSGRHRFGRGPFFIFHLAVACLTARQGGAVKTLRPGWRAGAGAWGRHQRGRGTGWRSPPPPHSLVPVRLLCRARTFVQGG